MIVYRYARFLLMYLEEICLVRAVPHRGNCFHLTHIRPLLGTTRKRIDRFGCKFGNWLCRNERISLYG